MSSVWGELIGALAAASAVVLGPLALAHYNARLKRREAEREAARRALTAQRARSVSWRAHAMRRDHELQRERIATRALRTEVQRLQAELQDCRSSVDW